MDIPKFFIEDSNFNTWIEYFFNILSFELPNELTIKTTNTEKTQKLNKNVYWKSKTICMNILFTIYRK